MTESSVIELRKTYNQEKQVSHNELAEASTLTKIEWIMGVSNILEEQERLNKRIKDYKQNIIESKKGFTIIAGLGLVMGIVNNLFVGDLFNAAGLYTFGVFLMAIIIIFLATVPTTRQRIKNITENGLYTIINEHNTLPSQMARYAHFKNCINNGEPIAVDATVIPFDDDLFTNRLENYATQFETDKPTHPETPYLNNRGKQFLEKATYMNSETLKKIVAKYNDDDIEHVHYSASELRNLMGELDTIANFTDFVSKLTDPRSTTYVLLDEKDTIILYGFIGTI